MEQKNKGKITIANILALLGLAALGIITFYGQLLKSSDGKPAGAIAMAVAIVVVLGFLLFMSIKAKSAEDNPDKWKFVEWGCIGAYIIAAVLFVSSFNHFFYIVSEKENMQTQARTEIKAIKDLYTSYEYQKNQYLTDANEQIQNYIASGQQSSINDELASYIQGIGPNIDSWMDKAKAVVKLDEDEQLKDLAHRVEDWNWMDLASLAAELEAKDSKAWTDLENKIETYTTENKLIPVIGGGGVSPYYLDGYAKFDLGTPVESRCADMIRNGSGISVMGIIIYVILNALVLLNYLVASRSKYVGPVNTGTSIGGLDL